MTIEDIALTLHPMVGARTAIHLLECFGSVNAIYKATLEELIAVAELKPQLAKSIVRKEYMKEAEAEWIFAQRNKIKVIAATDPDYPVRLRECEDYPHVIYVRGEANLNAREMLSIVGTRDMTTYGKSMCEKLVGELSERFPKLVIVSGLAYGVDVSAHRAALANKLPTVAIFGQPLNKIYPAPHTDTARRIVEQGGALISEFPCASGKNPGRSGFVQRNRVIAGMSDGVVVVESPQRGGSLITAEMADGYNRVVMAVPGRVGDVASQGTNELIRSLRAQMVCSGCDVVGLLDWEPSHIVSPPVFSQTMQTLPDTGAIDQQVLEQMPFQVLVDAHAQQTEEVPEADPVKLPFEEQVLFDVPVTMEAEQEWEPEPEPRRERVWERPAAIGVSHVVKARPSFETFQTGENSTAARLLELLADGEAHPLDELMEKGQFSMPELSMLLLDMEFSGMVKGVPGKQYVKVC